MKYWKNMLIAVLSAIVLSACSGDDADDLCEAPASTTGEPDITASPTFSAPTVPSTGGTVTVSVSVDADTQTVVVDFAASGTTTTLDSSGITDSGAPAAQTVDVDVTIPGGTTVGSYYPVILLCTGDVTTCTTVTAYAEDPTGFVSAANYVRGQATYNAGTGT